ncbi:MAG: F0F1 ATP synthase subunit delta [Candidatus Aminicenantes bacterium]
MEIDLFTFIAQIINFLILIILLRQLLYKRIVKAMDEREGRIQARLEGAEKKQEKADQEAESYRRKQEELEQKKQSIITKAEQEADEKKQDLLKKARQEVDGNQKKWRESLHRQKDTFMTGLRETAGRQIYAAVRKVLNDLADEELENQIIRFFIQRIENLDKGRKKELRSQLKESGGRVVIHSAFGIEKKLRESLKKAVNDLFDQGVELEFKKDSELVCGVELHARDQIIAWSIDSYLSELEEHMSRRLEDNLPRGKEEKDSGNQTENKPHESEKQKK